jgi:hypothetical protein
MALYASKEFLKATECTIMKRVQKAHQKQLLKVETACQGDLKWLHDKTQMTKCSRACSRATRVYDLMFKVDSDTPLLTVWYKTLTQAVLTTRLAISRY